MKKVLVTTDSSCDLGKEILTKRGIKQICLNIVLGNDEYVDGVTVTAPDIFEYVKINKKLPKTAALTEDQFTRFFKDCLKVADEIVHIGLSSGLSVQFNQSVQAALAFEGKVHVIDGKSLSSGTGLLVLAAQDLVDEGKTADQVVEEISKRVPNVQTSFIIQDTEYLYRGGRCSGIAMIGANLFKIKPHILVIDGVMKPHGMPRGKMNKVLLGYVDDTLSEFNHPDKKRAFLVHSFLEPEIVNEVYEYVKSKNIFDELTVSTTGSTIASHCGKGTLGFMYINDGNEVYDPKNA
ncbi:MAG: DegV family protein [bacterium]|nr:DegV family protein [bacterium]